ncbi:30S ribosomal protein S16 [Candidatus Obscuribacterales bacterium]|nr:30S ribosomal protein S16 [Candidatus Obscuribacterales bacterium]MBX3135697.1 30S ribosomal protein S16 [Candidatus Obscuribacterales bacterium]MBX3152420.1 30S ribosomal protein S16 [Candidatus Obscuribacterales bacterium]
MVKIRLKRIGAKKAPHYRIVAVDGRTRRDGKPIEEVGYYNPRSKELKLDREAVDRWMKNGAQPSDTVAGLIRKAAAAADTAAAPAAGTAGAAAAKGASRQS